MNNRLMYLYEHGLVAYARDGRQVFYTLVKKLKESRA
jgi:DNA-binding transcriptional ArsR family regulator